MSAKKEITEMKQQLTASEEKLSILTDNKVSELNITLTDKLQT